MESKLEIIEKILKDKNINMTKQRKEIINIFLTSDKHLKPEDVYEIVKQKEISLATVYRAIEIFKRIGIIKGITIGKDTYYELKMFSEKCMHIHFKCEECNEIYDYDKVEIALDLIKLRNGVEKDFGVQVNDLMIIMNGLCQKCREGK
jgi:Fur family transcriptional regulator, ferric uptake regulator